MMKVKQELEKLLGKGIAESSNEEVYYALLNLTKQLADGRRMEETKKKIYYVSAEFLIGKLLSNNMINLGIYDDVKEALAESGKTLAEIEEIEVEPSLGNGGLGRLAACFLDSIATLGLSGAGIGLNYHLGLFKQVFEDRMQKEETNPWIGDQSWLRKTDVTYPVTFGKCTLQSRLYEIDITGYDNRTNKLCLFDVETVDESIVDENHRFDKTDVEKNLTLFLYPDDSDEDGRKLRIYQQYFMVSNAARLIIDECKAKGSNLYDLFDYAVIQINDTHPTMIIPELIRLLVAEGMNMDAAIYVVSRTCAYTNHTILAEALEKWPRHYLAEIVPQLVPIIEILDDKVRRRFDDESVAIIDRNDLVHMAHIDIHYGFSVNGVAYLHTEILKNSELNNFYRIYPEKFNNKTNGITFRRWLLYCNKMLADTITAWIGDGYKKDAMELEKLLAFVNDDEKLAKILEIKNQNKLHAKEYFKAAQGIELNENSIFDIQVKRLHEYKRQLLNAMHIIYLYQKLQDDPSMELQPRTFLFGAKAAPGYAVAKRIIHLINSLANQINSDPLCRGRLQVVFLENYRVSLAEHLMPASEVSQQISTAGKEASGTGNMKFMMNGALTVGTLDGANVEMHEVLGDENMFLFGLHADEVARLKAQGYAPQRLCERDDALKRVVDQLRTGFSDGVSYDDLAQRLLQRDEYMLLQDFASYCAAEQRMAKTYADRAAWDRMSLLNIARSGIFAADRAVAQYADNIWHVPHK